MNGDAERTVEWFLSSDENTPLPAEAVVVTEIDGDTSGTGKRARSTNTDSVPTAHAVPCGEYLEESVRISW
jgi:hypothetical protein